MEPVFMILGQSAATAACLALDAGIAVQDLPYDQLKTRLLADKQVLRFDRKKGALLRSKELPGVVIDDRRATLTGTWTPSSALRPFVDGGYQHDGNGKHGIATARFSPSSTLQPGVYTVRVAWAPSSNRATRVPVTVSHADGEATFTINQKEKPGDGDGFHKLGTFTFGPEAEVEISNKEANGFVILDAVQWLPKTEAGKAGK